MGQFDPGPLRMTLASAGSARVKTPLTPAVPQPVTAARPTVEKRRRQYEYVCWRVYSQHLKFDTRYPMEAQPPLFQISNAIVELGMRQAMDEFNPPKT